MFRRRLGFWLWFRVSLSLRRWFFAKNRIVAANRVARNFPRLFLRNRLWLALWCRLGRGHRSFAEHGVFIANRVSRNSPRLFLCLGFRLRLPFFP
jgi:hypothetical protein